MSIEPVQMLVSVHGQYLVVRGRARSELLQPVQQAEVAVALVDAQDSLRALHVAAAMCALIL